MVKYKTLKKKFYILILFLGLFTSLKSQHCFWDYCRFIVLEVRDSLTNQIVDDLTIILSDGSGKPYMYKKISDNPFDTSDIQRTDSLKFTLKTSNNKAHWASDIEFGINCYMLLLWHYVCEELSKDRTDKIVIYDKKGRYHNIAITLDSNKLAHMCTGDPVRFDRKKFDEMTIRIWLKKIK